MWEAGAPRNATEYTRFRMSLTKSRHQSQRLVYESEHWVIDVDRRELRADGKPVSIGGRSFEILEAPLQAANELVAKDALIGRVRPGTIVDETSLQVHISALREAFGSDTTTAWINSRRALVRRAYGSL